MFNANPFLFSNINNNYNNYENLNHMFVDFTSDSKIISCIINQKFLLMCLNCGRYRMQFTISLLLMVDRF